jgi:ribosomal protein L36
VDKRTAKTCSEKCPQVTFTGTVLVYCNLTARYKQVGQPCTVKQPAPAKAEGKGDKGNG